MALARVFPYSDVERLPAYSGATVPAFDRLPAHKLEIEHYARAGGFSSGANALAVSRVAAFAAAVALALCGCTPPSYPRAQVVTHAHRIVALVPSLVEDLCAIGASREIVGVSTFTSDLQCVRGVPVVGGASSLDAERILAQHPDLVLAIPAQRTMTEPLRRAGLTVELLPDDSFEDIFSDIEAIGRLTGRVTAARVLEQGLRAQTERISASTRTFRRNPSVFVALGTAPIWTVGPQSYIATLIESAGGRDAVAQLPSAYATYSAEALLRLQPDAIVSDPAINLPSVLTREPWRSLRAVQRNHVFIIENAALLERPGPRYNEGLRWLVEHLEPLAK